MQRLTPELRSLLDDALSTVGGGVRVTDEELIFRFDEVMGILGDYLVTFGIAPDGELNALGRRIEDLEDWLTREKIDSREPP